MNDSDFSAADRACNDSMGDAREGLVVSCVDAAETYKSHASISVPQGLVMPNTLKLMPLYVLACLRTVSLSSNISSKVRKIIPNFISWFEVLIILHKYSTFS